ncbi:MAG: SGNH/GDSL hydrolase family protein [Bacteroidetes bacterium]|jgi:lysophospholipase L1-like esterase|nr:SGNH/GDSL hydrolase family protein [Bacteroidota bacterium]MBK7587064.1 SGNH/GDSL hydrolase family protein [Bacteroidota bacterium]
MKKYLALGDSYTIGEQVNESDNFPNQLYSLLNTENNVFAPPKIIATTGWTTDELATAIAQAKPSFDHDLVSLLIGVNNQYRGRSIDEYYTHFYGLMCQAILFAQSKPKQVVVLSIPDWGMTPFNQDRDQEIISKEIDAYNNINKNIALHFGAHYMDITQSTRLHANKLEYLTPDLLHYSAKEYKLWVHQIASSIIK